MGERAGDSDKSRHKSNIDRARKLIKLTERKAREYGVSVDDYLKGVSNGKYPLYTREEVDAEPLD